MKKPTTVRIILFLLITFMSVSSPLYAATALQLKQVDDNVYAIIGELDNRSSENLGNNATFGFVVTSEGVVLIDSGGTYQGAAEIHALIKTVTDKPVKIVINTGGQDHRWLGNGYFKQHGARLIANSKAVADQKARTRDQFFMMGNMVGDAGLKNTEAVYADETFDDILKFTFGNTEFELYHAGHAHTPGDSYVWLPQQRIVFTGDIVYVQRMLGVTSVSNSKSWVTTFEAMAALQPKIVVPGHGHVTTLKEATAHTYDYLVFLRQAVSDFMDNGGGIENIGKLDQSSFSFLQNYEGLKGRNAQRVYEELEWE
jgi:glyoxylase-like metal-dependent hydrolase (beta-lactamase superfamily II)